MTETKTDKSKLDNNNKIAERLIRNELRVEYAEKGIETLKEEVKELGALTREGLQRTDKLHTTVALQSSQIQQLSDSVSTLKEAYTVKQGLISALSYVVKNLPGITITLIIIGSALYYVIKNGVFVG